MQSDLPIVEGHSCPECAGFIRGVQSFILNDTAPTVVTYNIKKYICALKLIRVSVPGICPRKG